jgi:hypothetical protein
MTPLLQARYDVESAQVFVKRAQIAEASCRSGLRQWGAPSADRMKSATIGPDFRSTTWQARLIAYRTRNQDWNVMESQSEMSSDASPAIGDGFLCVDH